VKDVSARDFEKGNARIVAHNEEGIKEVKKRRV